MKHNLEYYSSLYLHAIIAEGSAKFAPTAIPDKRQIMKKPIIIVWFKKNAQIKDKKAKIMLKNHEYILENLFDKYFHNGIEAAPLRKYISKNKPK